MADKKNWRKRSLIEYARAVLVELEDRYGLEKADVDVESIAASQESGWTPREHVAGIGRKHGLIDTCAMLLGRCKSG